jgi:hypothetical protein
MVDVAQLVEPRIVIPAVAGSSPVVHPTFGSRASSAGGAIDSLRGTPGAHKIFSRQPDGKSFGTFGPLQSTYATFS